MKNILKINAGLILLLSIIYLTSCENKFDDYTPYEPTTLTVESVGLHYETITVDTNVTTIVSDKPTIAITDQHVFGIDTAYHSAATADDPGFVYSKLTISEKDGVITYNNSNGKLKPGTLTVDVTVGGITNFVVVKGALKIEVSGK